VVARHADRRTGQRDPGRLHHHDTLIAAMADNGADNGLVTIASRHPVKETLDRAAATVQAKGMTVFARIDHAAGAKDVGMALRPTELLIFGNAKAGTPLMKAQQAIGIDLPLKLLAWEDESGKVWLSYNDPAWLAARHGLGSESTAVTNAMREALAALAKHAVEA
jgi:uncharacterized protein (DUF302 family)